MNLYCSLDALKADLKAEQSTARDDSLLRLIEDVSRATDDITGRHYFDVQAVRDFDVQYTDTPILELDTDVVAIDSVATDPEGDGTYGTTITNYWLLPTTTFPRRYLEGLSSWPFGRARVRVTGRFGYSFEAELTTGTVQNNPLAAGDTTLTITDAHGISVGETIVIEDEQIYVSAKPTATSLTIVRGINGTTAAEHIQDTPIYRRRYPRPVERAVALQVVRLARDMQTGFSGQAANAEFGYSFSNLYPVIRDLLQVYRIPQGIA